jgi:hypothetical protein
MTFVASLDPLFSSKRNGPTFWTFPHYNLRTFWRSWMAGELGGTESRKIKSPLGFGAVAPWRVVCNAWPVGVLKIGASVNLVVLHCIMYGMYRSAGWNGFNYSGAQRLSLGMTPSKFWVTHPSIFILNHFYVRPRLLAFMGPLFVSETQSEAARHYATSSTSVLLYVPYIFRLSSYLLTFSRFSPMLSSK